MDRDTAGYMRYKQSSLQRVHARKATSQEDFCNSCASECNLSEVGSEDTSDSVSYTYAKVLLCCNPVSSLLFQQPEPDHSIITQRLWMCMRLDCSSVGFTELSA